MGGAERRENPRFSTGEDARLYPASKLHGWRRRRIWWSVSGRPGGGREFGDTTDWKITQPG
jgi:hypothetical protein